MVVIRLWQWYQQGRYIGGYNVEGDCDYHNNNYCNHGNNGNTGKGGKDIVVLMRVTVVFVVVTLSQW